MSANYFYVLRRDEDPEDPRQDQEWLGTMACWHNRYNLGDAQPRCDPEGHIRGLVGWDDERYEAVYDFWYNKYQAERARLEAEDETYRSRSDLFRMAREKVNERVSEEFDKNFISLPLYLYDHSGITMSTGRFSCPWDSGQVGMIYVSREKIRETYGWKVITKGREEKILGYLRDEVNTYDQYLTGDVYGYLVYEAPNLEDNPDLLEDLGLDEVPEDWQDVAESLNTDLCESVDSCWGFYGEESAKDEAESSVKYREEHHGEVLIVRQQAEARKAGQLELSI